jgi:hypothetical protein
MDPRQREPQVAAKPCSTRYGMAQSSYVPDSKPRTRRKSRGRFANAGDGKRIDFCLWQTRPMRRRFEDTEHDSLRGHIEFSEGYHPNSREAAMLKNHSDCYCEQRTDCYRNMTRCAKKRMKSRFTFALLFEIKQTTEMWLNGKKTNMREDNDNSRSPL